MIYPTPHARRDMMIAALKSGQSPHTVAYRFGCSHSAARQMAEALGIRPVMPGPHPKVDRNRRICDLWLKGWSGTEIAVEMGISRNAAIGVVARAGLSGIKRQAHKTRKPARAATKRPPKGKDERQPPQPVSLPRKDGEPKSRKRRLEDAQANECRWIAGDDDLCCGHETRPGSSFCPHHHGRAYQRQERPIRVPEERTIRKAFRYAA